MGQLLLLAGVFIAVVGVLIGGYLFINRRTLAQADAALDRLRERDRSTPDSVRSILREANVSDLPALDVIIQPQRLSDGTRRIVSITEVTGMEGEVITTQEVYRFKRRGVTPEGRIIGQFEATGVRPTFTDRLRVSGIELPSRMFEGLE